MFTLHTIAVTAIRMMGTVTDPFLRLLVWIYNNAFINKKLVRYTKFGGSEIGSPIHSNYKNNTVYPLPMKESNYSYLNETNRRNAIIKRNRTNVFAYNHNVCHLLLANKTNTYTAIHSTRWHHKQLFLMNYVGF